MVYSTCSILKEENEEIIKKFLKENLDFQLEKINLENNNFFEKYIEKSTYLKVYPNEETDGFFICKLNK